MNQIYLTGREVQFLFDWFIATTKGEQCDPIFQSDKAEQEDKDIYNKLINVLKGE